MVHFVKGTMCFCVFVMGALTPRKRPHSYPICILYKTSLQTNHKLSSLCPLPNLDENKFTFFSRNPFPFVAVWREFSATATLDFLLLYKNWFIIWINIIELLLSKENQVQPPFYLSSLSLSLSLSPKQQNTAYEYK